MSNVKDTFNLGQPEETPQAGFYTSPLQSKVDRDKVGLPTNVTSRILTLPNVRNAHDSFGLEGLKSILLQELINLDYAEILRELVSLAEGAQEHLLLKRTLRATKLLAAQWMDDSYQKPETQDKCRYIFEVIPTFGTIQIKLPEEPSPEQDLMPAFPDIEAAADSVPAEAITPINKGTSLVFMTDLQGHYSKLEKLLLTCQLVNKTGSFLHWIAPKEVYFILVGDLLSKSPFSTWGDTVGFQSFDVIMTVQRLMQQSRGRLKVCFGSYDLEIATGAAFYHPISGFMGSQLGVNAQAQAIPIVLSFLQGLAQSEPDSFESPWWVDRSEAEHFVCVLKPEYQLNGYPHLVVPADTNGVADIAPLITFYQQLLQWVTQANVAQRPKTIAQIDQRAAQLIPAPTARLNLEALKTSSGRCAHFAGLLQGSGTLDFLRQQIAGIHILEAGEHELFACHSDIQENTLDMLEQLKTTGNWEVPEMTTFLSHAAVLYQRRLQPDKLIEILQKLKFESLNDWLALSETTFYQRLVRANQLGLFVPAIIPYREEKAFTQAYRQLRWDLMNEDSRGLAGYAINAEGLPRRGEPVMKKAGALDERARRSYTSKFLTEVFREDIEFRIDVMQGGEVVAQYPMHGEPEFLISLLLDDTVAVYKDPKEVLHMPIKHAAWVEYK